MSWNISRRDAAETNASPQPTRHKKNPRKPGSSVSGLGQLIFGALLSRFNCRKDQRGHKQPEQDRRDHQRERENHRGHSAHDPTEVNGKQTCRKTQSMSLLGVKRTWVAALNMSAFDPKRTCGPIQIPLNARRSKRSYSHPALSIASTHAWTVGTLALGDQCTSHGRRRVRIR